MAAQTDARLQVALDWTEGFGGRECPYLHDHHGAVVWHGVHGVGTVVLGSVRRAGSGRPPPTGRRPHEPRARRRPHRRPPLGGRDEPRPERYAVRGRRAPLPALLGRPAPALAGQPLHLRRRAVAGGLLPLRLGRVRVRLLGGHRPLRELLGPPVVVDPEDRRPVPRRWTVRAVLRLRVDLRGLRAPERDLRRRRPRGADLLGVRRGHHRPGRAVGAAGPPPGVPGRHDSAPPGLGDGLQRLGLPPPATTAAWSRSSRHAAGNYEAPGCLPAVLRRHPARAPSPSTGCCAATASVSSPPPTTVTARATWARTPSRWTGPRSSRRCTGGAPSRPPPATCCSTSGSAGRSWARRSCSTDRRR